MNEMVAEKILTRKRSGSVYDTQVWWTTTKYFLNISFH